MAPVSCSLTCIGRYQRKDKCGHFKISLFVGTLPNMSQNPQEGGSLLSSRLWSFSVDSSVVFPSLCAYLLVHQLS